MQGQGHGFVGVGFLPRSASFELVVAGSTAAQSRPDDVPGMAGYSNYRVTLDRYVGATGGVLGWVVDQGVGGDTPPGYKDIVS